MRLFKIAPNAKVLLMRKKVALDHLRKQSVTLSYQTKPFEIWLSETADVLLKTFPRTGRSKVQQLMEINELPAFYMKFSTEDHLLIRKNRALMFMANQIEEIELLGPEKQSFLTKLFGL